MEQELRAGPLRCKFADGELRYIKLGDTEVVRRVFFAVRTKTWDTLTPRLSNLDISRTESGFSIVFDARCERDATGYDSEGAFNWSGKIEGKRDGTIVFTVTGAPTRDFETNRIGLCVLFGTPTVCGQKYTLQAKDGPRTGTFPKLVNAPLTFEEDFTELRYGNVRVSATGDGLFSMEDQRNFADSSFKAYQIMPYAYPKLTKGDAHTQTITIKPEGFLQAVKKRESKTSQLVLGEPVSGATLPEIRTGSTGERNWFHGINHDREKAKAAASISFAYFPVEHLYDDDTCWENVPVIVELAESARQFAPGKPLDIHHIALTLTHPRTAPEPRNASPMGAAWAAVCLKYAGLAGVRSATFDMGPGYANRVLKALTPLVGKPLRSVSVNSTALTAPVEAFGAGQSVVVVNKTGVRQQASLEKLPPGKWDAIELQGQTPAGVMPKPVGISVRGGKTNLNLAPHEVRILTRW
ncbi:hypothetical protein [Armatimonas sp.]|uniref:hypothetical protein n=1 Tax=Armatimonas sp. TaxID=1872638 RepID=UPI00286C82AA|nr:hypothetical protein [Armatimonas sp.]